MRISLFLGVLLAVVFLFSFGFTLQSYAQCIVTGATPGGGEVIDCQGNDPIGVVATGNPDEVTVQPGANITTDNVVSISVLEDGDTVNINGGVITTTGIAVGSVTMGVGDDVINMQAGTVNSDRDCLRGGGGEDRIQVFGGVLNCGEDGIVGDIQDDIIFVAGAVITSLFGDGVTAGDDNDTVTLGSGANIVGDISGGDDIDTLIFAMQVPSDQVVSICDELEAADPATGSIEINNLFYEWKDFEIIQCNISGGLTSTVPTLSEWGLLAMASILGIIGFMVIRRRKVAA